MRRETSGVHLVYICSGSAKREIDTPCFSFPSLTEK
jgi:hypothetical protein